MIRLGTSQRDLERAAEHLRLGELVAVPTETVYGLAADASNPDAVRRIFEAKSRPADHPLIVHLPGADVLADWAARIPDPARRLAEAFWPGPLTLILPRSGRVDPIATGGQDTVGLRVPGHPVTLALLKIFGGGLAAPSANRFGRISPTRAEHVIDEFGQTDTVAAVIDGGPCQVGVESTIVDCSGERPRILRPGMISAAKIGELLGETPSVAGALEGPRASGRLASHYAPETPVTLVDAEALTVSDASTAVLALSNTPDIGGWAAWRALPEDPASYARGLYAALRALDGVGARRILVQVPPGGPEWAAVMDRLDRARS